MNTQHPPLRVPTLRRLPRLSGWLLITLLLSICVALIAPHQLPVSLYKFSLVSLAAVVGYWLDRSLFPYGRPDAFLPTNVEVPLPDLDQPESIEGISGILVQDQSMMVLLGIAMLRRAIIVGSAMLAMGLGA